MDAAKVRTKKNKKNKNINKKQKNQEEKEKLKINNQSTLQERRLAPMARRPENISLLSEGTKNSIRKVDAGG